MRIKSSILGAMLGGIALVAATLSAQAAEEIIFGISAPPGSLQQQTAAEFTKRANAKLSGVAGQNWSWSPAVYCCSAD